MVREKLRRFYMTTGLVVPNEGHVYIDDQEITNFPVYKRARAGIGYLHRRRVSSVR